MNGHHLVNPPTPGTCMARLPIGSKPREEITASGWLRFRQVFCTQSVGLRRWTDLLGRERIACPLAGHLGDVMAQANADELAEKVRHDVEAEGTTREEMLSVRPELVGWMR